MQIREILTILYFFLTIYSFGGGAVQGIANYSSWKLIGAEDFPAVHRYVNRRIFLVYVPFFFLSVLINIALIWFHHPAISTTLIVIGFSDEQANRAFTGCRLAGHNGNSQGVQNEESEYHPDIFVCGPPRKGWPRFWQDYQSFG